MHISLWILVATAIVAGIVWFFESRKKKKPEEREEMDKKEEKRQAKGNWIEDMPWLIFLVLLMAGLIVLAFSWWGIPLILLSLASLVFSIKRIQAKPPHVGLVTILGERKPIVKKEGLRLLAPHPFRFIYDVIPIKAERINVDFSFKDIRTRQREKELTGEVIEKSKKLILAGGELEVNISLTYNPDYRVDAKHPEKNPGERLIAYINSGEESGVNNIIHDLIAEDIRQMAAEKSWEEITFATDELKWRLVKKLTGRAPKDVKNKEEVELLEGELKLNGFSDIADLGIAITRFNVGRVKEMGKLAEAAEKFATETKEMEGEIVELNHVRERIKELVAEGFTPQEARDIVQTERGKVDKRIQEIVGIDLEGLGRGLGEAFSKRNNQR